MSQVTLFDPSRPGLLGGLLILGDAEVIFANMLHSHWTKTAIGSTGCVCWVLGGNHQSSGPVHPSVQHLKKRGAECHPV